MPKFPLFPTTLLPSTGTKIEPALTTVGADSVNEKTNVDVGKTTKEIEKSTSLIDDPTETEKEGEDVNPMKRKIRYKKDNILMMFDDEFTFFDVPRTSDSGLGEFSLG
ncbi:hypothetical protein J1N35_005007 [Gossypium stocksii]|uniref:Uncharacterized protein n=1 Tax=Gossypium stocksii TaxID=47602 RepID=A0A9D4AGM6_9ROSI|nr:hypothetical protein J1N35_005007 [Gossypium stocksii]